MCIRDYVTPTWYETKRETGKVVPTWNYVAVHAYGPVSYTHLDVYKRQLHGHLARANPQWKAAAIGEAMVLFSGPDAYVTPSWYETKRETGKVVPTWNYQAVHAYGPAEFFDDPERLLDAVTRLTNLHEGTRAQPWAVDDAPPEFVRAQLRGIVGLRIPITRLEGKRKMSQNRPLADRRGVAEGLGTSERASDLAVAAMVPVEG